MNPISGESEKISLLFAVIHKVALRTVENILNTVDL